MVSVNLENIVLKEQEDFCFNDYFSFHNNKNRDGLELTCIEDDKDTNESSQSIFRYALDLALPEVVLRTYCKEGYSIWVCRKVLNSYSNVSYIPNKVYEISDFKMNYIKKWFQILVEYAESTKEHYDNLVSSWNVTLNEYNNAIGATSVEKAYIHLLSALESALVNCNCEVQYKVTLSASLIYSQDKEERQKVKEIIKKAYTIRNMVMTGDMKSMKVPYPPEELYEDYFKLKDIVSTILLKTYGLKKSEIIQRVEESIFDSSVIL